MTGSKPKPSCKLLSLLTSRASLGSANFPPIEIELRTPRRRRRHTHLWEPRIIAAAGNRGHLWGEQHGIETRTKRNHSWVNSGRLTIGGNYSRSPLDETPTFAADPRVFGLADLVERLAQMAHDVEFVEQDCRLQRPFARRVAKRLPHVHHRQANAVGLLLAQPIVELRHARLRAILPAEPDWPAADQVVHHDTVAMALADRDLIDA